MNLNGNPRRLRFVLFGALAFGLIGCKDAEPEAASESAEIAETQEGEQAPAAEESAARPALGRIVGRVVLKEGASLPSREIKFGDALRSAEGCPEINEADHQPVFFSPSSDQETDQEKGEEPSDTERPERPGLVNILVSLTGDRELFFKELPPRKPQEIELIIRDCRLEPRLVAGVTGDELLLKNRSDRPMLPFIGQQGFVETLSSGETRRTTLEARGVSRVGCGVTGYCGSADLVVLAHPVFGVTGELGRFEIEGVPADQELTLHAWHPLFQEIQQKLTVPRGETVELEIVIEPLPSRAGPSGDEPSADGDESAEAEKKKP